MSRARRRDRWVYLRSHPFLFALVSAGRGRPARRLGSRVLVHGAAELHAVLTRVPLDRTAENTTGGAIRRHAGSGALFDQSGDSHRAARRDLAARLDSRGVTALRPAWAPVLDDVTRRLATGAAVDLCAVADELAGRTTAALLGWSGTAPAAALGQSGATPADCLALAVAARRTAASAAAAELPSLRRTRCRDYLAPLFGPVVDPLGNPLGDPLAKMLALAAVNTTYAAVPRSVAWTADAGLWPDAADPQRRDVLVAELLRVTAPTPLLPRVPAADTEVGGVAVRAGEQLLLVTRHAVDAHRREPSVDDPAPHAVSQLVFGAGPHACPGAGLARAQLNDVLAALAPFAPVVVRASVDRSAALPAWRELRVAATIQAPWMQ